MGYIFGMGYGTTFWDTCFLFLIGIPTATPYLSYSVSTILNYYYLSGIPSAAIGFSFTSIFAIFYYVKQQLLYVNWTRLLMPLKTSRRHTIHTMHCCWNTACLYYLLSTSTVLCLWLLVIMTVLACSSKHSSILHIALYLYLSIFHSQLDALQR